MNQTFLRIPYAKAIQGTEPVILSKFNKTLD